MGSPHFGSLHRGFLHSTGGLFLAAGIPALILYLFTMSPSWGFVDGGELSAVAATLGIAHPTGYPTTTMFGYLAVLVSPFAPVLTLNILAALFCAISVGLLALLMRDVLSVMQRTVHKPANNDSTSNGQTEYSLSPPVAGLALPFVAILGALLTGTGVVWWMQGTRFEVYVVHLSAMLLSVLLFLRYTENERTGQQSGFTKSGNLFGFFLGLTFTTHLLAVLWLPAFAAYYFASVGFRVRTLRRLLYVFPSFLVGLLFYLYLPIRAATDPIVNWGDPDSFSRFFDHVSGVIFQDKMFAGGDAFIQQTQWFFSSLPGELAWGGLLLALVGLVTLFRRQRLLGVFSILVFCVTVLWSGNYTILDVEAYYLPAIVMVGLWAAIGLGRVGERYGLKGVLALGIALLGLNVGLHFGDANLASDDSPRALAVNMLENLPKDAVLISSNWDFYVSGSLYAQYVEGIRTDVTIVYSTLLQYPWYQQQLEKRAPVLMRGLETQRAEYTETLNAFMDKEGSEEELYARFIQLVDGIIHNAINSRPVLVTGEVDPAMGASYWRVPNYLALRLMPTDEYVPQEFPTWNMEPSRKPDPYSAMFNELYARSFIARGLYEESYGITHNLQAYINAANAYNPHYDLDEVPDFPLNGEEQIRATSQFFDECKAMIESIYQ